MGKEQGSQLNKKLGQSNWRKFGFVSDAGSGVGLDLRSAVGSDELDMIEVID